MAVALIVSCKDDKKEGGQPSGTTAPTLGEIEGGILDAKGAPITSTYGAADFGVTTTISYELCVADAGKDMAGEAVVKADIAAGAISMTQSNLSLALQKLGHAVGDEVEAEFALYAYIGSSRGKNTLRSNLVQASYTVCAAKQDDSNLDKIEVIGDFDGWGSEGVANAGAYLYKYGEENIYSGLVYYYAKTVNGWKLRVPTADGNWDDSANWGIDENELADITAQAKELYESGNTPHPEFTELTLANAGSSKDIKIFNHNFYYWIFDRDNNKLNVDVQKTWESDQPIAFDYMYAVGDFNGWAAFQAAAKMKYIPKQHTFYIDLTLEAGKAIKFMADGQCKDNWYIQWGAGEEDGKAKFNGGNITVPVSGNARVYFDVNHLEISFDTAAYGTEEEGGVDVAERALDRPDEYYIRGKVMGKEDWNAPVLTMNRNSETGVYGYYGLSYKVGDMFKVVKNDAAEWYGVAQMEPYTGTNTLTGSDNFEFAKDGGFDVTFDPATGKVSIADCAIQGWGLKGNIRNAEGNDDGWNSTFPMTLKDGIWVSDELEFLYDGVNTWGFKLCLYGNWAAGDIGVAAGTTPVKGTAMPAVDKLAGNENANIQFNGKGVVEFNPTAMTITIK